jgi:hypothetical protein
MDDLPTKRPQFSFLRTKKGGEYPVSKLWPFLTGLGHLHNIPTSTEMRFAVVDFVARSTIHIEIYRLSCKAAKIFLPFSTFPRNLLPYHSGKLFMEGASSTETSVIITVWTWRYTHPTRKTLNECKPPRKPTTIWFGSNFPSWVFEEKTRLNAFFPLRVCMTTPTAKNKRIYAKF